MSSILSILLLLLSFRTFAFDHDHTALSKILSEALKIEGAQTLVNYKQLKKSPRQLDAYLETLSNLKKSEYDRFSKDQKLALMINAYNAFTLKLMRDAWPVKSIRDLGSLFTNPWKKEFFKLLGQERHLDWIEHEVIRKEFNEPRIHFAVNCASIGCPALRQEAFIASKLDSQLEEQAKMFLNDKSKNTIKNGKAYLSKIFEWYGDDFIKEEKNILIVLNQWRDDKFKEDSKIDYLDYDWAANSFESN
ncbi:MAG: hypothetical protein COW01_08360 [Bdellovibrionales bacterium CG12_big_fil_rev_8_21_14_0_65_38_15]|nr:MAG: hypothetical protein COW79_13200 [Bdellovibrionales bacterium CG22_combo_CG10-13_8_21_14_all_38_13]PIQ55204.1 MAG: hypothetical protein COW01_08360 [Bdellovibrionales bacterium CG12_big_fil_rev_8_21_14_0_65_38_15]PIR28749.1 MAG: hypothetical protein COV38_14205 [Bdellovibrionales bacterium CG11_big_fil_rev_8_21_14_0_20_38_13]